VEVDGAARAAARIAELIWAVLPRSSAPIGSDAPNDGVDRLTERPSSDQGRASFAHPESGRKRPVPESA